MKNDLLEAAASAFEDGRDPFSTAFLREHNVSADDCMGLSTLLSVLLRAYLWAPKWIRNAMLVSGAMEQRYAEILWNQAMKEELLKSIKSTHTEPV